MSLDLERLLTTRISENDDFSNVIVYPTQKEFESIQAFINLFPDLVNIDAVSPQFVSLLGEFIGYRYLETEDIDVQREIVKRVISEYHKKGSVEQLYKVLDRASDPNFFIGDLTYYHGPLRETYSMIQYPVDTMFKYDGSAWDRAKYPDYGINRMGVVELGTVEENDRVYEYLDRLLPAGIKYYIFTLRDFSGTDGSKYVVRPFKPLLDLHEAVIEQDINVDIQVRTTYDIWAENAPYGGVHTALQPTDISYTADLVADQLFIYNEQREQGLIVVN